MTADLAELLNTADSELIDATHGSPAAATAHRVIAALRSLLTDHTPTPYQPSGGSDPDRYRMCGADPTDDTHPDDPDGPAYGGSYRCTNQTIKEVCEGCHDDRPGYGIHAWPCQTASIVIHALTNQTPTPTYKPFGPDQLISPLECNLQTAISEAHQATTHILAWRDAVTSVATDPDRPDNIARLETAIRHLGSARAAVQYARTL